jgi:tetratricopeptide (TPR) repeat protein
MMLLAGIVMLLAAGPAAASSSTVAAQLKTNIARTDRAIAITEAEATRGRVEPYSPELQFRLAELYVEKSRYLYLLHQEEAGVGAGSQVAPEVKLVKQKAIDIYERLLRDAPDWSGDDRAHFYLAHELRELGQFDRMLQLEQELADKHPDSPLAAEAMLIVGDHWFDAKDLARAETAYQRVLAGPATPTQDLARFKMGWIRLNQGRHADALSFFEAVAMAPAVEHASNEVLNVKREAIFDLVFSYTEVRPWQGSVEYFEKLAGSHALFAGVLEKLANRYFIKQEAEAAVPAYRRLLELSHNPDRDVEFAGRLYQSLKAAGDKSPAKAVDVENIVRVAARVRVNERLDDATRKTQLDELEVEARDLATGMLVAARKAEGSEPTAEGQAAKNKGDFSEAADAHQAWLSLFRESPQKLAMERNEADALFRAGRWHEAGRMFEAVADQSAEGADKEDALYNALAAFARAVPQKRKSDGPVTEGAWRLTDSRRAMALLGARYVESWPKSPRVAQVKFNVARAAYDAGDWKRAAELFAAFVNEHPTARDVPAAADLALDALHIAGDYEGLEATGNAIAKNPAVAATVRQEMADVVAKSRNERLSTVALQSSAASGDAASGLVTFAESKSGTELGEQALYAAFSLYREKKDLSNAHSVATRFLQSYGTSPKAADVLATLARAGMELADFDAAAVQYEALHERFPHESSSLQAARTAATLEMLLGDVGRARALLERVPATQRDSALWRQLAEAELAAGDAARAESSARAALEGNRGDAAAAVLLGRALLAQHKAVEASNELEQLLSAARRSSSSETDLANLWDIAGEAALRALQMLPPDPVDPKVAALKHIQEATTGVAQLNASDLAVAGIYRLAAGFESLSQSLTQLPAPAALSAGDKDRFLSKLREQANGLHQQAEQAFQTCATKARELEVFAPFVTACASRTVLPEQAAPVVTAEAPSSAGAVANARGQLKWGAVKADQLEELGLAQLSAGDLRRARLTLQRAVEVDATRASAQSGLGIVLARLGEWAAARAAYGRALELDASNGRAHAGLAALLCHFGWPDAARAELGKAPQGAASALGPDPDLARCGVQK